MLAVTIVSLMATSCKKDAGTSGGGENVEDLVVPAAFDWGTSRDVNFSVSITDARFQNSIHVISIYAGDPAQGGALLSKGSATLISAFNTRVYLPNTLKEIFIEKTAPDGSSVIHPVEVTSTSVSLSIGAATVEKSMKAISAVGARPSATAETSPACPGSGSTAITNNLYSTIFYRLKVNNSAVYAVTASNVTVTLDWGHNGTLYICGKNVTVRSGNMNGLNIIVTNNGSVNMENVAWNSAGSLRNFGQVTLETGSQWGMQGTGTFYNTGTLTADYLTLKSSAATNFGTITVNRELWLDASVEFTNHGSVTSKQAMSVENGGQFVNQNTLKAEAAFTLGGNFSKFDNYGTFKTTGGLITANAGGIIRNGGTFDTGLSSMAYNGSFTNDGSVTLKSFDGQSGTLTNRCKFVVLDVYKQSGTTVQNQSFIDVRGTSSITSGMSLSAQALFQTKDLLVSTDRVSGPASGDEWALFRVSGTVYIAVDLAGGSFSGNVMFCGTRTLLSYRFVNGSKQGCDIYIPASNCSAGYGTAPKPVEPDTDKDGVIDIKDDYPNDPTRAYKHLQATYATGGSTVAFEDRWPLKGDYDMNDVVLNYRYEVATNANNQVVWVKGDYTLLATGGEYQMGAGIQFNIPKANLISINGAEVEDNQDSIVVILFKNSRQEQANWNTSAGTTAATKAYSMSFAVKNGPAIDAFGVGNYNMFIWNNSPAFGRGYETHLPNRMPTKLATQALFGTADDNTPAGKPYYSKAGMPWALELPLASFSYPVEKADITKAYLKFADWAKSGGTLASDWYSNAATSYRNQSLIFSK